MTTLGMDPDKVAQLARALDRQRTRLQEIDTTTERTVTQSRSVWRGDDVNQFTADWNAHRRDLLAASDAIDELVQKARANIAAQVATSNDYSGGGGVGGSGVLGGLVGPGGEGTGIPVPDWPLPPGVQVPSGPLPPTDNPNFPLPPGPFPLPPIDLPPADGPFPPINQPPVWPEWPLPEGPHGGWEANPPNVPTWPPVDTELYPGGNPNWPHGEVLPAGVPTGYDPDTEWGLNRHGSTITRN